MDGNRVLLSDCFSFVPFIRDNNGAIKELVDPGDGGSTALPNGPLWLGKRLTHFPHSHSPRLVLPRPAQEVHLCPQSGAEVLLGGLMILERAKPQLRISRIINTPVIYLAQC